MLRFKSSLAVLVGLLFCCVAFFVLKVFTFDAKDQERYHQLMHQDEDDLDVIKVSNHRRTHLRKDLYFNKGDERLQMWLKSAAAELKLERQGGKSAIVEHMKDVVCYMQEEIFYTDQDHPMQVIRCLKADVASYHYQKDLFVAENVQISRYLIPGIQLDDSLEGAQMLTNGLAKKVEFSLKGEANFRAYQLKSSFYPSQRLL